LAELDRAVLHRLANIKSTYERASVLLLRPTSPDVGIGLVLLDTALEAILKLAIDKAEFDTGVRMKVQSTFPELVNAAATIPNLEEIGLLRPSLLSLHRARNGFQHNGIVPDISSVTGEYQPLTVRVMSIVSTKRFGIEWSRVSISLLIKNSEIRSLYQKAESAFSSKDWIKCASYLIYTFESMKQAAQSRIYGSGISVFRLTSAKTAMDPGTRAYVSTLDQEIETFKLGLDYLDLRNYLDVAQNVGIGSILDDFVPSEEAQLIEGFSSSLQKAYTGEGIKFLEEWCARMQGPILRFILKTEADERFSGAFISEALRKILSIGNSE
jgi:hypothetical protein